MAARAIWKGSISFGLVNIPIRVFSGTQNEDYTSFSQLCDKGHKIKYKKWCPVEEREVQWSEIKKGYEITKNNYIIIEKEDLDKIKLKTNNTIEVKEFIKSEGFDPIFIERNYFVGPDPGKKKVEAATRAYSLLVKILHETGKIAIGKVDSKELSLGRTLVDNLTTEKFDPSQYSDTYAKELEKLIEAKSKGQEVVPK